MSAQPARVFSREFKEAAVQRILAGEKVKALAVQLGVARTQLYNWWEIYERRGPEALPAPAKTPQAVRIAELERKVGQQTLELDFFAQALRPIEASRPATGGRGETPSSRSSTR